jgi:TolB protein
MQKFLRLLLLGALTVGSVFAQRTRDIGEVTITVDKNRIPIRVAASSPELQSLALQAFNTHGRYKLVASGYDYDVKFSAVAATQVRVDVTKGAAATPVASEIVNGTSARNALLRAADVAVVKTNGLGLRGFFASRLAFVLGHGRADEVGTADLFFGEAQQITRDNAHVLKPRWSPDGAKLIYTSFYKSGSADIFLIDLATHRRDSFASYRGTNSGARFSPDGRRVAMVLSGSGTPEIYLSGPEGVRPVAITKSDKAKASPSFSPDGSQLVFEMEYAGPQLFVMPVGGGTPRRLVTGFNWATEPDWSRVNPNKIACTVRVPGGKFQIAVYDLRKGTAEVVSQAQFDGVEPSWLPDGRHLVYTARDQSTSVLAILDTESGQSKRISAANLGPVGQASVWAP